MTVEVGILNKQGIALAADSAVTVGDGKKFYNTANKLFMLSKYNPVGIMIYNNAELLGCPVEILVKEYRKKLAKVTFASLEMYWNNFLQYLLSMYKNEDTIEYYLEQVESFLEYLDYSIKEEIEKLVTNKDESREEIQERIDKIIKNVIQSLYGDYCNLEDDMKFKSVEKEIYNKCYKQIKILIKRQIGWLDKKSFNKVVNMCLMILTKKSRMGNRTGIVITGFGENELYPSLIYGEFLGIFFGEIKYSIVDKVTINDSMEASVIPFAQVDVINTFMNGIDNYMFSEIIDTIDKVRNDMSKSNKYNCDINTCMKCLKKSIEERIKNISSEGHWGPIMDTISIAPKEELAHMAETLVNLTSFRKKLSMDAFSQSVGGPIDVALITKGDGFIWMKRKHYFNKDYNYNFFQTYYK